MDVQAMHCQGPEQCSRRLLKSRAGSNTVAAAVIAASLGPYTCESILAMALMQTIRAVHTADELAECDSTPS